MVRGFFGTALALTLVWGGTDAQAGMLGAHWKLRAAIERSRPAQPNLVQTKFTQPSLVRIKLAQPTLAPMAYTQFCQRYVEECLPQNTDLGEGQVRLTAAARTELDEVNTSVNMAISPERNERGLAGEAWLIAPDRGDCNDYAVTKRHELMARGWPSDALLLAEVATGEEHHLVLVVRSDRGDLVLDNLTDEIKVWTKTSYRFLRMQTPSGSMLWAKLAQKS